MKHNKINFQDVIDIFKMFQMDNAPEDKHLKSGATRKGHKHAHSPARKPSVVLGKFFPIQTPAQWRRMHASKG